MFENIEIQYKTECVVHYMEDNGHVCYRSTIVDDDTPKPECVSTYELANLMCDALRRTYLKSKDFKFTAFEETDRFNDVVRSNFYIETRKTPYIVKTGSSE